jgi:anthranilate phosphoribosyltransferase
LLISKFFINFFCFYAKKFDIKKLKRSAVEAIRGGDAPENARIIRKILAGEKGPKRDVVLLNAAAAFVSAGFDGDFRAGIERATESIDSGQAAGKLDSLVDFTQQCGFFVRRAI